MKVDLAAVQWSRGLEFGLVFLQMQAEESLRLRRFLDTFHTRAST